jgi:outer membrane protein
MNNKIVSSILGGVALVALLPAQAAGTGGGPSRPNSLRLGYYFVSYNVNGTDLAGPFTTPGLKADLKKVQTPYFAYVRQWTTHFQTEFAFGVPPKTTAVGKGPAAVGSVPFNGQELLTARWFSPTVLFNWVFRDESAALRPYIGVGVNHTRFYERKIAPTGVAIIGGPTTIELSNSTGLAATAGISYHIKDAWNVYASYSASNVVSDLKATTAGIVRTSHIDFNPRAVVVSVGYSF